jgi:hypothetical protein
MLLVLVLERAIAEMMQHNTALHTINLSSHSTDQEIYTDLILPALK